MAEDRSSLVPTQMRQYYEALHALKEQEHTKLAELHAEDPSRLIGRFVESVKTVAAYDDLTEPFHPVRSEKWMDQTGESVKSTTTFTANLAASGLQHVAGHPELDFEFVDREIFPLRSTEHTLKSRSSRVSIDLLLKDPGGCPVVGELKVGDDSLSYPALIQSLAYGIEISSPSQLRRLTEHYDFRVPDTGPAIGIYLIGFDAPEVGKYRKASFDASAEIARKLMADERVNGILTRIVYLKGSATEDGGFKFERLF